MIEPENLAKMHAAAERESTTTVGPTPMAASVLGLVAEVRRLRARLAEATGETAGWVVCDPDDLIDDATVMAIHVDRFSALSQAEMLRAHHGATYRTYALVPVDGGEVA